MGGKKPPAINKKSRTIVSARRRGGDKSPKAFVGLCSPPRPLQQRRLRDILLMSRTPLLGWEGKSRRRSTKSREPSLARADGVVTNHQKLLLDFAHPPVRS